MIIYKPKRKGQVTKRKAMVKTGKRPAKKKAARRKRLPLLDSLQTRQNMQRLSVIIPVRDEERTIGKVLKQVVRLRPKEIIVIANGSRDRTIQIATTYNAFPIRFHWDTMLGERSGPRKQAETCCCFLMEIS